jgi:YVTN family beta-propeller protein
MVGGRGLGVAGFFGMKRKKMLYRGFLISVVVACFGFSGCAAYEDVFGDVGEKLAGPSAMVFNAAADRMYLVNSNDRVLYDWRQGNFQVLDVTNPLAPVLVKSARTLSFSGQIYLDEVTSRAIVPNRFSDNDSSVTDLMYSFSTDEAVPEDLLSYTTATMGLNSYAIACCYPARTAWITTSLTELQYVDLDGGLLSPSSVSLVMYLDTGETLSVSEAYHVVLRDNQAILTRDGGGIMFVNLDKRGVAGATPVDYMIADVGLVRGLAYRNDRIYVVGEGDLDGYKRYLLVIDVTALTPLVDNSSTKKLDKDNDGLLVALIEVGNNPQEVLLTDDYAFVTNMDDDTVSVVELATNAVVKTITVGDAPFSLALYKDGAGDDKYVYVGNIESNTISIIDVATLSVAATYQ